jgi:hypothetical protein
VEQLPVVMVDLGVAALAQRIRPATRALQIRAAEVAGVEVETLGLEAMVALV